MTHSITTSEAFPSGKPESCQSEALKVLLSAKNAYPQGLKSETFMWLFMELERIYRDFRPWGIEV
jgi:hypothetical protein